MLYFCQMPGSLIGCWQQRAFKGCACNLNPAVTATDDWANPSSLKKKLTMQTSHRFTGTFGWSSAQAISWMLKGKQMGSLRSNEPGANKNRPVPLVSIMCDLLDLIFISSSPPKQNAEPLSAALCVSLTFLLSLRKPWTITHCLKWRALPFHETSDQQPCLKIADKISLGYTLTLTSSTVKRLFIIRSPLTFFV